YFGSDPSRYAERSSLQGLLTTKIPLMIAAAELDPPRFVEQFNLLKQATCKGQNGCARATMVAAAQSHVGSVCDQRGRRSPDRRDFGFHQNGKITGATCTAPRFSPRSGR